MKKSIYAVLCAALLVSGIVACKKKTTTENPTPDCNSSSLALTAIASGSSVTVTGSGGTAPYTYSKDNVTFQESNVLTNLPFGTATVYIKDANCTKSTTVNITGYTDSRDGKIYPLVKIGEQIWFAKSIQYNQGGDVCLNGDCDRYGRYYDFANATTVCPQGYRLPSDADWVVLEQFAGMPAIESYYRNAYRGVAAQLATKLGVGGSLGLNLELSSNGSIGEYYTSVTDSTDANSAYMRQIVPASTLGIGRLVTAKNQPRCVRCLKN